MRRVWLFSFQQHMCSIKAESVQFWNKNSLYFLRRLIFDEDDDRINLRRVQAINRVDRDFEEDVAVGELGGRAKDVLKGREKNVTESYFLVFSLEGGRLIARGITTKNTKILAKILCYHRQDKNKNTELHRHELTITKCSANVRTAFRSLCFVPFLSSLCQGFVKTANTNRVPVAWSASANHRWAPGSPLFECKFRLFHFRVRFPSFVPLNIWKISKIRVAKATIRVAMDRRGGLLYLHYQLYNLF